jgi:hypothetical protein
MTQLSLLLLLLLQKRLNLLVLLLLLQKRLNPLVLLLLLQQQKRLKTLALLLLLLQKRLNLLVLLVSSLLMWWDLSDGTACCNTDSSLPSWASSDTLSRFCCPASTALLGQNVPLLLCYLLHQLSLLKPVQVPLIVPLAHGV